MPNITNIRCVLLSSPYADADDPEIKECFPNGPKRTIGMVEITLDDGTIGLGEGYLAVFAPLVFKAIVDLCVPYLLGKEGFEINRRTKDLKSLCDYWSLQGAARHVISAFEIALHDAKAKSLKIPVYDLFGGTKLNSIQIYGSGGCCDSKEQFLKEFALLEDLGIKIYKIRSVKTDIYRTAWVLNEAEKRGIRVGVDMCQNLADPPQSVVDVELFVKAVHALSQNKIFFLEEALGPDCPDEFHQLRTKIDIPVCGGEIITTPKEMINRIKNKVYEFVQPDASVIGGLAAVSEIFEEAARMNTDVVVHAWGGAAAIMASYHVAFARAGKLVEFPMLDFPLAKEMMGNNAEIKDGFLICPKTIGLGLELTREMEKKYIFDESAVYCCILNDWGPPPDLYWK